MVFLCIVSPVYVSSTMLLLLLSKFIFSIYSIDVLSARKESASNSQITKILLLLSIWVALVALSVIFGPLRL